MVRGKRICNANAYQMFCQYFKYVSLNIVRCNQYTWEQLAARSRVTYVLVPAYDEA